MQVLEPICEYLWTFLIAWSPLYVFVVQYYPVQWAMCYYGICMIYILNWLSNSIDNIENKFLYECEVNTNQKTCLL